MLEAHEPIADRSHIKKIVFNKEHKSHSEDNKPWDRQAAHVTCEILIH